MLSLMPGVLSHELFSFVCALGLVCIQDVKLCLTPNDLRLQSLECSPLVGLDIGDVKLS